MMSGSERAPPGHVLYTLPVYAAPSYGVSRGTALLVEAQQATVSDAQSTAAALRWCRAGALLNRLPSRPGGASEARLRFFQARGGVRFRCALGSRTFRRLSQLSPDGCSLAYGDSEVGSALTRRVAMAEVRRALGASCAMTAEERVWAS